jgi:hypothetical protein
MIFVCMTLFYGHSYSQDSIAFKYKGHPVHPLLIKELLPNLESNTSIGCVDLDSRTDFDIIKTVTDRSTVNSGTWYLSHFSGTGYTDYHIVSTYKEYYCIIVRDVDGSLPLAYICFLSLGNKKLCLAGCLDVKNIRDDLIRISGDDVYIGSTKHSIKSIIFSNINH